MAGPYLSDNGDGQPLAYTIGDAGTGEQLFLCLGCVVTWCRLVLDAAGQPDAPAPPLSGVDQAADNEPADSPAGLSPPGDQEAPAASGQGGDNGRQDSDHAGDGAADQLRDQPLELGERESAGGPPSGA